MKKLIWYLKQLLLFRFRIEFRRINPKVECIKTSILIYFNKLSSEIYKKGKGSRKKEKVYIRYLTAYFMDIYTKLSYTEIGKEIGKYDHSTISWAKDQIGDWSETDISVKYDIEKLKAIINNKIDEINNI